MTKNTKRGDSAVLHEETAASLGCTPIGIDPGQSGGIAALDPQQSSESSCVWKMPETECDLWMIFERLATCDRPFALIELVSAGGAATGGKKRRMGATGAFKFGRNYGCLLGMLTASKIPFDTVSPRKWQSAFGLARRKDESTTAKKNRHKQKASQLFPELKVTLATCDALLIATYCYRQQPRMNID